MIRSTFEEEMSRFEAEIGSKTAAQLASASSNPFQQTTAPPPPQLPPQKYLGTTLPGNIFTPARPPMVPSTLLNTSKSNPFTNNSGSSPRAPFLPPPPPAILLNSLQSTPTYTMGNLHQSAASPSPNFHANKGQVSLSSAPTLYNAASTNKPKSEDGDEDILAILQKTEKEVKKEQKKTGKGFFMPSSVSAAESGKKAKLMAESVKNSTTSTTVKKHTVQVPQSTKDRMMALKNNQNER